MNAEPTDAPAAARPREGGFLATEPPALIAGVGLGLMLLGPFLQSLVTHEGAWTLASDQYEPGKVSWAVTLVWGVHTLGALLGTVGTAMLCFGGARAIADAAKKRLRPRCDGANTDAN